MKYTRGTKFQGDYTRYVWDSTLYVDIVSIQKDILKKKTPGEDLPTEDIEDLQAELDKLNERWESAMQEDRLNRNKRPLLTEKEWGDIRATEGKADRNIPSNWDEWQGLARETMRSVKRSRFAQPMAGAYQN